MTCNLFTGDEVQISDEVEQRCKSITIFRLAALFLCFWIFGPEHQLFPSLQGVPEEKSLEERLLCVEISETSVEVIELVMEVVATLATFVNFLPLGNRVREHKHLYFLHLSVGRTTTSEFAGLEKH